jgi:WD40 repeat protein
LLAYSSSSGFSATNFITRVRIFNFTTHENVRELSLEFMCTGLAFSPDGARLVTSTPNFLTLWDVRTGAKLTNYPFGSHQSIGTSFSITPDFRRVAQAFGLGQVRVVDLATGRELWTTNASKFQVEAVALSGDGRWLATADANDESVHRSGSRLAVAGASDESVTKIWNALDGRLLASFAPQPGGVMQLLFGSDNRTLISANTDQTIRVWDVANLASLPRPRVLMGHQLEVWRLALMPNGTNLVSGGKDGSVRFWDLTRLPRNRGPITLPGGPLVGWSFSESESDLLTCDTKGRVSRWSGEAWQTNEVLLETGQEASTACFLPERHEVVIAGRDFSALHVYRWGDSGSARVLPVFSNEDARDGWKWIVRRHGNRLAVGQVHQPMIHDFDLNTWELKESWRAPPNIFAMDFTADERTCIMGGYRGHVMLRNLVTREESSFVDDMPNLGSVAFSKLGDRVAISCEQGFVRLWNTGLWQDVGTLRGFLHAVHGLSFSPDGRRLAAGSSGDEAIRLYEMERHQPLITFRAEGVGFFPAFDSSGNVLAAMNAAGKLYVWRAPSWAEIEAAEKPQP